MFLTVTLYMCSNYQLSKGMELGHVSGVEVVNCTPQVPVLTEQSLPAADDYPSNCEEMQQFLDGPKLMCIVSQQQ